MPSLIYDPDDRARPYKLFGYSDRGYCVAFSKDGIHFKPAAVNPVIPLMKFPAYDRHRTWFSEVALAFKDAPTGKYVSHVKTYQCDHEGRIRRCVGYAPCSSLFAIRYRLYALCIIYFLYSPRINPLSSIFLANDGSMRRLGSVCFACGYWSESISSALFITGNDGNGTSSNSFLVY